jgi:hypothetical protein
MAQNTRTIKLPCEKKFKGKSNVQKYGCNLFMSLFMLVFPVSKSSSYQWSLKEINKLNTRNIAF